MSNDLPGNDFLAVAKFRLEGVHDQQCDEGLTDAAMLAAAIDAQVQATLALAYEQRTANLIALSVARQPSVLNDLWEHLMEDIATRLGLDEVQS